MSGLGKTTGGRRLLSALLMLFVALSAWATPALAQESSPFGRSDFTSPRFGTHVAWSSDWVLDRAQSALEQRREIIVLSSSTTGSAVFIELHSQRSFRTAESLLSTFMERFTGDDSFTIIDDQSTAYPAAITFSFDVDNATFEAYAQAEAVEGAMLVTAILSEAGSLEDGVAAADGILVDGRPLLDPLPICGDATSEPAATSSSSSSSKSDSFGSSTTGEATATPETSSSSKSDSFGSKQSEEPAATPEASGDSKSGSFGSTTDESKSDTPSAAGCITLVSTSSGEPQPTPTPRDTTGKNQGLNDVTYRSPTFGASFRYDSTDWGVEEELVAADNNGRDSVTLSSWALPASVVIEFYAGNNGKASVCIDLALREWGISPSTDDPIVDADGNPIAGTERGRVWAAYAFTYDDTDLAGYVECRALPGASGVMVITLLTNPDSFARAYADLIPILDSIDTHG